MNLLETLLRRSTTGKERKESTHSQHIQVRGPIKTGILEVVEREEEKRIERFIKDKEEGKQRKIVERTLIEEKYSAKVAPFEEQLKVADELRGDLESAIYNADQRACSVDSEKIFVYKDEDTSKNSFLAISVFGFGAKGMVVPEPSSGTQRRILKEKREPRSSHFNFPPNYDPELSFKKRVNEVDIQGIGYRVKWHHIYDPGGGDEFSGFSPGADYWVDCLDILAQKDLETGAIGLRIEHYRGEETDIPPVFVSTPKSQQEAVKLLTETYLANRYPLTRHKVENLVR